MLVRGRCVQLGRRVRRILLGRRVHWHTAWASLGSFGVAGFIGVRPVYRWIRSGSLGSMGCALGVVGFVRGLWFHWEAHRGSSGFVRGLLVHLLAHWGSVVSFGVAGLIGLRPVCCRVPSASLGSLVCTVDDVGLFGVRGLRLGGRGGAPWGRQDRFGRLGLLRCALEVVGLSCGRWVHWGAPLGTSDSLGVSGYIGVGPVCRPVRSWSLD